MGRGRRCCCRSRSSSSSSSSPQHCAYCSDPNVLPSWEVVVDFTGLIDEENLPWFFGSGTGSCDNRPKYEGTQVFYPDGNCFWTRCGQSYGVNDTLAGRCVLTGPTGFIYVSTPIPEDELVLPWPTYLVLTWYVYSYGGSHVTPMKLAEYRAPIEEACGPATFVKLEGISLYEDAFPATLTATRVETPEECRQPPGEPCCDKWGDEFTLNAMPLGCEGDVVPVTMTRLPIPGVKVWDGSGDFCGDTHYFVFRCDDGGGGSCAEKFGLTVYPGCGDPAPMEATITGCDCGSTPPTFTFQAIRDAAANAGCGCCGPHTTNCEDYCEMPASVTVSISGVGDGGTFAIPLVEPCHYQAAIAGAEFGYAGCLGLEGGVLIDVYLLPNTPTAGTHRWHLTILWNASALDPNYASANDAHYTTTGGVPCQGVFVLTVEDPLFDPHFPDCDFRDAAITLTVP